jgi:hypothetical protein
MFRAKDILTHKDFTKYPKLFATVYWGRFEGEAKKEVIDNRNDFVTEFDISGQYEMPKYMCKKLEKLIDPYQLTIDHIETYKTKDNKCVIVKALTMLERKTKKH